MKERLTGIGLAVGTALTLGSVWVSPAEAFSLGSTIDVTNTLAGKEFQTAPNVVVTEGSEPALLTGVSPSFGFGDMWNIDLDNHSILFSLNSKFAALDTGNDVYKFKVINYVGVLPSSKFRVKVTQLGKYTFGKEPTIVVADDNRSLDVIFQPRFNPQNAPFLKDIPGGLKFKVDLIPVAVPSPALLPGLVGLGVAALRKRRQDSRGD